MSEAPTETSADPRRVSFAFLDGRLREAVEQLVAAGRDPDDAMAGFYISPEQARDYAHAIDSSGLDHRLAEAGRRLGLDGLETAALALCAAPELDPRYTKIFSFLHDDVTRKLPSPRLIADLLSGENGIARADTVACFASDRPLRGGGAIELLDPDGQRPFLDRSIRLAEPLTSYLLGARIDDARLHPRVRRFDAPAVELGRGEAVERLRAVLGQPGELPVLVAGPDAAALLAVAAGRGVLLADVKKLGDRPLEAHAALVCALEERILAFDGLEELDPEGRARVAGILEDRRDRVILCAGGRDAATALGDAPTVVVEVPAPTLAERRLAWANLSGSEDADEVAAKFRLSLTQIDGATAVARAEAGAQGREQPAVDDLESGARQASRSRLGELAAQLEPAFDWDDLVLRDREQNQVRSISAYLRHRDLVLGEWGYAKTAQSAGLKVLFAGESGTGKTMAAQVLANDLGLDLFRVDLATIVSKYIGETEKNLDRIFNAAEGSNAILFFDEADALFGKRSEVSDSHDRYANIEVAYLLQKMEGYAGVVILATNFKQNMDDAFVRRLDFAIDFPFPEPEDRRRIWELVLPTAAPVAADVDLDFLSEQFKLSGGSIRNCSVSAAFEAAEAGEPIGMAHLVRAVAAEYGKQGRLTLEADFERFTALIRPPDRPEPKPDGPAPTPEPAAGTTPPPIYAPTRTIVRSRIEEIGGR